MRVAIVSANFGGYDEPRPQTDQWVDDDVEIDWWYATDRTSVPGPWRRYPARPASGEDPRLYAKQFKCVPWASLSGYERYVWLDANMEVVSPTFITEALAACAPGPVAAWAHPRRDCVYDEVEASLVEAPAKYGRYADALRAQAVDYLAEGYPAHAGLYACGTVVWDGESTRAYALGLDWLAEIHRTTIQDQVSFPVVARRLGIVPATFPVPQLERPRGRRSHYGNRWVAIHPHLRED